MILLTNKIMSADRLLISPSYVSDGRWALRRSALDPRQNACLDREETAAALVDALRTPDWDGPPKVRIYPDDAMLGAPWLDLPDEFEACDQAIVSRRTPDLIGWLYRCGDSITAIDGRLLRGLGIDPDTHPMGKATTGWALTPLAFGAELIMCMRATTGDSACETARVLALAMELAK